MSSKRSPDKTQKLFVESARRLQQGDAAGARRGLEKVAKLAPKSAVVWYNLALAAQHLGQHEKAVHEYGKSLQLSPGQVEAVVNTGLSLHALGRQDQALAKSEQALEIQPGHPRALNLGGSIHAENRDYERARVAFEQSLAGDPGSIDARQNLANALLESGHPEQAAEVLAPLLARAAPGKVQLELQGQILLELKEFDQVQPIIKHLKTRFPEDQGVQLLEMAFCELINDNFSVVDIAEKILARDPTQARVWNSLGSAYFQLDSIEHAKESYQKAIDYDPDHPEYQNNIGLAWASLGQKDQAETSYRQSLALNNEYIEAYRNLVAMRKFRSLDDPDVQALVSLWERGDQNDLMRCKLAFALGKVYDDCGLHDLAFETYDIGNRLKSREITMDFEQYFGHIDRIIDVLDRKPRVAVERNDSDTQPIFILGMSRSGTTLVEQLISRHPDVTGCGELSCIERAISRLEKNYSTMHTYPDDFPGFDLSMFEAETAGYFDWVSRLHTIRTGHFTDKMPFNFVHVWLIRALFPDAAIVHCHRHPLDVITSNYFQLFGSEINFVYDLRVLAGYYIRYHRLMKHWHKVFGQDNNGQGLYKVQYEALVADNENQTRALVAGVGLGWDDACLEQTRSDTAVRTASIWQVREGIYTSSRERWRQYEKHLTPAINMLREEGILDDESRYID